MVEIKMAAQDKYQSWEEAKKSRDPKILFLKIIIVYKGHGIFFIQPLTIVGQLIIFRL